jgi:hypothetical protein
MTPPPEPRREQEEQDMRQQWVARGAFEQMIHDSTITDIATIAAYALLRLREGELTSHDRPAI